jgi:cobalt/nickel transport system ATP-binding protein
VSCSVELTNLSFKRLDREIFSGINLQVGHKEKIAIIGPNGCGKTSLLECVAGLEKIDGGEIRLFHKHMASMEDYEPIRVKIGYLLQDADNHFLCPIVEDDIAFSLLAAGVDRSEAQERTLAMMRELDIENLRGKVVYHLSGGEKKLAALAGVLIKEPSLLLLDEPTNALDYAYQLRLAEILAKLDKSVIIVSHNQEFIERVVDKIYTLSSGGLTLAANLRLEILHSHGDLPPHTHPHSHLS